MRFAVVAALAVSGGCDALFRLQKVEQLPEDAPIYFEYDAVALDTSGWPTNGNVAPAPCDTGSTVNEDGDAWTDECDNCPLDATEDQMDTDRDGIGDICDPHPKYAVERLALFNGFNEDGNLASAGTSSGGNWSVSDGLLRQQSTAAVRTLLVLAGGPWRQPMIQLRFQNVVKATTVGNFWVGAYQVAGDGPVPLIPDGTQCRIHYGAGSDFQMTRVRDGDGSPISAPVPRVNEFVSMALTADRLGESPRCDAARDIQAWSELTHNLLLVSDSTDPEPSRFAVFTVYAAASFAAFAVYETTYP